MPGIQRRTAAPAQQQQAAPQQGGTGQRSTNPRVRLMQDFCITFGNKPSGKGGYNVGYFPTVNDGVVQVSAASWGKPGDKFPSLRKSVNISDISIDGTVVTIPLGNIKYDVKDANLAQTLVNFLTNVQPRQARQQQSQGGGDE